MADYTIKADDTQNFSLLAAGQKVGELTYEKWFSLAATMQLVDGVSFQLKPKGFWETTIELQRDEITLLHFSMGWNGNIIIQPSLPAQQSDFVFKQRSLCKNDYALMDYQGLELLVIQPDFKWQSFNYNYRLVTTETFETFALKEVWLLLMAHCANYHMTFMMAAV